MLTVLNGSEIWVPLQMLLALSLKLSAKIALAGFISAFCKRQNQKYWKGVLIVSFFTLTMTFGPWEKWVCFMVWAFNFVLFLVAENVMRNWHRESVRMGEKAQ